MEYKGSSLERLATLGNGTRARKSFAVLGLSKIGRVLTSGRTALMMETLCGISPFPPMQTLSTSFCKWVCAVARRTCD